MRPLLPLLLACIPLAAAAERKVPCDFTAERGICLFGGQRVTGGTPLAVDGIKLERGTLTLGIAAGLKVATGTLEVERGWVALTSDAGALRLSGGDLLFRDASLMTVSDSDLTIDGGSLTFSGSSALIDGGSFIASDASTLSMRESTMSVSGGNVMFLNGGDIRFDGNSTMTLSSGSMEVSGGSMLRLGGGSSISISGGDVVFSDKSSVDLEDGSSLSIDGGNFRLSSGLGFGKGASMRATRVDILADGHLQYRPGSSLVLDGSTLALGFGATLHVAEDAIVEGTAAALTTPDGALSFETLALLDAACAGDAVVAVSREGKTSLSCQRAAKKGEQRAGDGWTCQDPCLGSGDTLVCGPTDHL